MTRRAVLGLALAALIAGCGVSTEDEPQPLENTTVRQPPAIPSVDIEPGPTAPTSPTSPSTAPPASSPR